MFNTLYDDENHGIELARLKRSQQRALRLCKKLGIKRSADEISELPQEKLSLLIGLLLDQLESKLRTQIEGEKS